MKKVVAEEGTMQYSSTLMGKSTREVMRILGVTEPTLRMWILTNKIIPIVHPIGTRKYYDFPDEEIERVRKLINRKWKQGKPKLVKKGKRDNS